MYKILFVCTGATCRSPMAEKLMKSKLKTRNIPGITAASAGISVEEGARLADNSRKALKTLGVNYVRHTPKQITKKIIADANLILTMTEQQKNMLKFAGVNTLNIFSMAEFTGGIEIADPYGKPLKEYIKCLKQMDFALNETLDNLKRKGVYK